MGRTCNINPVLRLSLATPVVWFMSHPQPVQCLYSSPKPLCPWFCSTVSVRPAKITPVPSHFSSTLGFLCSHSAALLRHFKQTPPVCFVMEGGRKERKWGRRENKPGERDEGKGERGELKKEWRLVKEGKEESRARKEEEQIRGKEEEKYSKGKR